MVPAPSTAKLATVSRYRATTSSMYASVLQSNPPTPPSSVAGKKETTCKVRVSGAKGMAVIGSPCLVWWWGLAVGRGGCELTVGVLGGVPVPTGTDVVEDSAGGAEVTVLEQVGFRDVDSDTSDYELFAVGER